MKPQNDRRYQSIKNYWRDRCSLAAVNKKMHSLFSFERIRNNSYDQNLLQLVTNNNAEDSEGQTPLCREIIEGKADFVEGLLYNGADPNKMSYFDGQQRIPLQIVQEKSQDKDLTEDKKAELKRIAQLLIEHGAAWQKMSISPFFALECALAEDFMPDRPSFLLDKIIVDQMPAHKKIILHGKSIIMSIILYGIILAMQTYTF